MNRFGYLRYFHELCQPGSRGLLEAPELLEADLPGRAPPSRQTPAFSSR